MPLFGAWLSDRIIGRYHTILWVSLFYCAGHGLLASSDFAGTVHGKLMMLVGGLGLIAFGSGGIKPCVSAFMGDQFKPEQSHLVQKAYGAFYWAINFGSFFSFLVVPWVKDHHGYSVAFGVPGILMAIATFVFWLGTKHYVRVPPSRETKKAGFMTVFLSAYRSYQGSKLEPLFNLVTTIGLPLFVMVALTCVAFMPNETAWRTSIQSIGWVALVCVAVWYVLVVAFSVTGRTRLKDAFWQSARARHSEGEIDAAKSLSPILFVLALIPVFWSLFDQSNSTWVLQGEKMTSVPIPGAWLYWVLVALAVVLLGLAVMVRGAVRPAYLILTGLGAVTAIVILVVVLLKSLFTSWSENAQYLPQAILFAVIAIGLLSVGMRGNPRWVRLALGVLSLGSLIALFVYRHGLLAQQYTVGAEEMQSANPLLVMILVPLLTLGVYPRIGRWASPLRRMSVGMFIASFSYVIVAMLQARVEAGAQISVLWQMLPYVVLTTAEVLISTTGLEFAFREAAADMKSILMSFWLVTVSLGDILVAGITQIFAKPGAESHAESVSTGRFYLYAGLTFVVAILFTIVAAFYKYRDEAAAQGK
jgi:dipeptide/tripeptide permease